MEKIEIKNEELLGPAHGPYSQGLVYGNLMFTAQCGGTAEKFPVSDSVYEQTIQAFKNAAALFEQAGSSLDKVLKITVYLTDMNDFAEMNRACAEMLPNRPRPARATVGVNSLAPGAKVEIDFIAAVD